MENNQKILQAIESLTAAMEKGFSEMNGRFENIESRLDRQEKKTRSAYKRQQLQTEEIENLKRIVQDLARESPARTWPDRAAIRKSDAYPRFEDQGITPRTAMRALRSSGTIRPEPAGKGSTMCVRIDGRCTRVIVVETAKEAEP